MSPYREDGAREPSDGITPGEREARERRVSRRRAITIAVSVPLALVAVAALVGLLLDATSHAPPVKAAASAELAADPPGADADADDAAPHLPGHGRAWGTVGDYCYEGCPTYAEAWANVQQGREPATWCVTGNRAGPCNKVETGTCGALRYVKVGVDPVCGGSTQYFDEAGTMVAVMATVPGHTRAPDGAWHDPIGERTYGHVPSCELVPSESACVKPQSR